MGINVVGYTISSAPLETPSVGLMPHKASKLAKYKIATVQNVPLTVSGPLAKPANQKPC